MVVPAAPKVLRLKPGHKVSFDMKNSYFTAQCGNVRIFLPFRFYVKSILADFRRSKSAFLTILEALNFDFWKTVTLEMSKIAKN